MERERGQPVRIRSQREGRGLGSRDWVYPSRPSRGAARAGPGRGDVVRAGVRPVLSESVAGRGA